MLLFRILSYLIFQKISALFSLFLVHVLNRTYLHIVPHFCFRMASLCTPAHCLTVKQLSPPSLATLDTWKDTMGSSCIIVLIVTKVSMPRLMSRIISGSITLVSVVITVIAAIMSSTMYIYSNNTWIRTIVARETMEPVLLENKQSQTW